MCVFVFVIAFRTIRLGRFVSNMAKIKIVRKINNK